VQVICAASAGTESINAFIIIVIDKERRFSGRFLALIHNSQFGPIWQQIDVLSTASLVAANAALGRVAR
jgi:hypothetical protein